MQLLALECSPKKKRNTETLMDAVLEGALTCAPQALIHKVYVNDLSFRPCQDCGYCRKRPACCLQDDMQQVYGLLEEADGIVLGAPTYYGAMCAQAKMLIDRCFRFVEMIENEDESWTFKSRIEKPKRLIFAGTNGSFGQECCGRQEAVVGHLCNDIHAELFACLYGHNTDYLPVASNETLLTQARDLGREWMEALLEGGA